MPGIRPVELSVEEAADLLHVQPATVRRRLARHELRSAQRVGGGQMVRLSPADDWLRVEDAAALLGVSPTTVRANIRDGRLTGRREKEGRWRVLLRSVLEDRRCDPAAVEAFGGEPATPGAAPRPRVPHSSHRAVYVRLREEDVELLERCRDRHGTIQATVVAGLRAIDESPDDEDVDVASLRVDRDLYEQQLARVRVAHRNLSERARERMVDEIYCPVCETFVPIEETAQVETEDGGVEVFHEKHGHRSGSRFRSNTVIARRGKFALEPSE